MTHDTQAARLADEAKRLADSYANASMAIFAIAKPEAERTELHATIDALRDLAIPAGEAVAWIARCEFDYWRKNSHRMWGPTFFAEQEGEDRIPLYASPQPTPEASQDGGGARAEADRFGQWFKENHRNIGATPSMIALSAWMAALRSPLPGRESTAQAGAGDDDDFAQEFAQATPDKLPAAAASVLAMREALEEIRTLTQRSPDMNMRTLGIAMGRIDEKAAAALASTLPEPRAGEAKGLFVAQEPKYTVSGSAIVNRASGEAIPADEPVFIFRARDWYARKALSAYEFMLPPGPHRFAVCGRVVDFARFADTYPDRMKEPDTAASPIATPKPQERKPLTQAQINEFIRQDTTWPAYHAETGWIVTPSLHALARAVERAHGIVPQDGETE